MSTETFKKRQKENARREKQKLKLARKIERKNEKVRGEGSSYDDDLELVPQNAESEPANSESGVHEESSH
jgi:hypothetical protein